MPNDGETAARDYDPRASACCTDEPSRPPAPQLASLSDAVIPEPRCGHLRGLGVVAIGGWTVALLALYAWTI